MNIPQSNLNFSEEIKNKVDSCWSSLSDEYIAFDKNFLESRMLRRELSFHDGVKLLGYFCHFLRDSPGAIIEIGLWKGKSLAFMKRMSNASQSVIGIDPLEISGQRHDFQFFRSNFFADALIFEDYSEVAFRGIIDLRVNCKLLHIDGGHKKENVVMDFLLYERLLLRGGLIVFDDYNDSNHSPEVKMAIDMLLNNGFFRNFEVFGCLSNFENSFVLRKK